MGIVLDLNKWANFHTYYSLDLVRVAFGVFLFFKGVEFMTNHEQMAIVVRAFQEMP